MYTRWGQRGASWSLGINKEIVLGYRTKRATRIFMDGGFDRIVESFKRARYAKSVTFFSFFFFTVLEKFQENRRKGKEDVLSLLILRDHLCYARIYI